MSETETQIASASVPPDTRSTASATDEPTPRWVRWALAAVIAASLALIVVIGCVTQVRLGDESVMIRFAENLYTHGRLVSYDHLYASPLDPNRVPFVFGPVWPAGLAALWGATGISFCVAQVYQAGWLFVLLISTWFYVKKLHGSRAALASVLLVASMPMMVLYSVLLYLDMPYVAVCMAVLALLVRRRYLSAGLALGLAYLVKRNGAFMVLPALVVMALQDEFVRQRIGALVDRLGIAGRLLGPFAAVACAFHPKGLSRRALWGAMLIVPLMLAVVGRTMAYQYAVQADMEGVSAADRVGLVGEQGLSLLGMLRQLANRLLFRRFLNRDVEKLPSSMLDPADVLSHLGLPVLAFLIWHVMARFVKGDRAVDRRVTYPMLWFYIIVLVLFTLDTDIRYAMPVGLLLAVVAGRRLGTLWRRRGLMVLVVVCVVGQVGATGWFLTRVRRLDDPTQRLYAQLEQHVEPEQYVLYPDASMILHARRRMVWTHFNRLASLFWPQTPESAQWVLDANDIAYIIVPEVWVYDDGPRARHLNGYPRSFVRRLDDWPFLDRPDWAADLAGYRVYRVEPTGLDEREVVKRVRQLFDIENLLWQGTGGRPLAEPPSDKPRGVPVPDEPSP